MIRSAFVTAIIATSFFCWGCSDIVEKDIADRQIVLVSPVQDYHSPSSSVQLNWEPLEGAREYVVVVVRPNFNSIQSFVADTTVAVTRFDGTFTPGKYEWKVAGRNNGGVSRYSDVRTFYVDSVGNLADANVVLFGPANNYYADRMDLTFRWQTVPDADDYRFQLFDAGDEMIVDQSYEEDSAVLTMPSEGSFRWQVRAQNALTNSMFAERYLTVDTTHPGAPVLLTPSNNDTLFGGSSLTWNTDTDEVNPFKDSVYVYADSTMSVLAERSFVMGHQIAFALGQTGQRYFWFVRSVDKALNVGPASTVRSFFYMP